MSNFRVAIVWLMVIWDGSVSFAMPSYSIVPLGLQGVEHSDEFFRKFSSPTALNEAGQAIGQSIRYRLDGAESGSSAWFFDGSSSVKIGLTGAEHTRDDGYKVSYAERLSAAGQVRGYSERFSGGSVDLGRSAWLYDGTATIDIGLTGPEHTRGDTYKFSSAFLSNEAGLVGGTSERFAGGSEDLGLSAWLYNGAMTINISLTGAEHTRDDGYRYSGVYDMNEAGQVLGDSQLFNGVVNLGYNAWIHQGASKLRIGLTGPEYTRDDGYQDSLPALLNEAGQATGVAQRFSDGNADLGYSAWFYDGITAIPIGLTGPEHTDEDTYRYSYIGYLSESGKVSGSAERYNGGSELLGFNAWLYDGTTTHKIGLTGPEHTGNDDYQSSFGLGLNEAGQVIGTSLRYDDEGAELGQSAWLYNGTTTIDIGLTGPEHTGDNGFKYSFPFDMNESGQVIGYSDRFIGGNNEGQETWFYDPDLDQTIRLELSETSEGFAPSRVEYLGEDGLVLGSYTLIDEFDNNLGQRAFSFTLEGGMRDLGELVEGGLTANDWERLAVAISENASGQILGVGWREGGSDLLGELAYLLTPLPLPGDYNANGIVDAADYTIWRDHLNQTFDLHGENPAAVTPGVVDAEDFAFWKSQFGQTFGSGAAAISQSHIRNPQSPTAVPEPATALMLLTALALRLRRRTREREFHR